LAGRHLLDAAKSMRMGPMPESPFGRTDEGFEDYRGITLAEAVRYLSIERVDLSDAVFKDGASINESEAKGCKFERIDMRNVFVRRKFDSCGFVGAKLNGARLGGEFIGCDFSRSNLSRSFATDCKFVDCKFAGANLSGIHFISCVFDGCDFTGVKVMSGSVARSRFVGGIALEQLQGCITDGVVIR
jgi:fluoroquinolone resistance protein